MIRDKKEIMKKQEDQTKHIEELQKQAEEWKTKYVRALADYQNLEKRTYAEKEEIRKYAAETILERLLPVLDSFELAQKHLNDQGLVLALKKWYAFLAERGVERIDTVGREFNPHEMECVEVVIGEDNNVIEEVLPGYKLFDKVLRVAQVKVGRSQNPAEPYAESTRKTNSA